MIVVGLGNPGAQYDETRHNLGFMVLDALVDSLDWGTWKRAGQVEYLKRSGHVLVKPQEFMNVSGPTLQSFFSSKKILWVANELMVIHDDLDFPLGTVREDRNRSSAGHQGVQSLIDTFGTEDFWRLRLGIGDNRARSIPAETYVLQPFPEEAQPLLADMIGQAVALLQKKLA